MAPLKNTRLAWGIALASLALWATTAPMAWGQVLAGANHIVSDTLSSPTDDPAVADTDTSSQTAPCIVPLPTQVAVAPVPGLATPSTTAPSGATATFHLCGPDQAAAQAIEQLIAGRSFSATLSARGDGCADLTIQVTSPNPAGSASSHLVVSLASGKALDLSIASSGGATQVNIGVDQ
jgi:hypothetical protein